MSPNKPENDEHRKNPPESPRFDTLVARSRSGDHDATSELIENYRKYLLFLANEDVDPRLQAKVGASDAVQESMLHAQMNFDQFNGNSEMEFKAWLRTILTNDIRKGRRQFRAQKRDANREINIQEQSAVGRGLMDAQLTPSSEAIKKEKAKGLRIAISQLTPEQQQVIQLRNIDQLSFEAIGEQMQRSAEAARKLWARSIEALKVALKSNSPDLIESQHESFNRHE